MTPLFAYIDFGTGTLLFQGLVLVFASIAVFFTQLKVYILGLFGFRKTETLDLESEEARTISLDQPNQEKKAA